MKTKEKVIELLKENRGEYLSGQQIADKLFVTRACVWKCIKALLEEGYEIDAVTNKGYRLKVSGAEIDAKLIQDELSNGDYCFEVFYKDEVVSTNNEAIDYGRCNKKDAIFIANSQTGGKGRRGRSFYSPKNTGLYMSILLHTNENISQMAKITAITASAVARAIDDCLELEEEKSKIKWVNDIYFKDKKVCGILCETHSSLDDPDSQCIAIGIGINVFCPEDGFPKEISQVAGSLIKGDNQNLQDVRNRLVVEIVKNLHDFYKGGDKAQMESLKLYREKSYLLGSYIQINPFDGNHKYAKAIEITDDYRLVVEYENGKREELSSGEVSTAKY